MCRVVINVLKFCDMFNDFAHTSCEKYWTIQNIMNSLKARLASKCGKTFKSVHNLVCNFKRCLRYQIGVVN